MKKINLFLSLFEENGVMTYLKKALVIRVGLT
jgi:hypothetical protein